MKRLTDVEFWDEKWWAGLRPRKLRLYRDFDFETVRLLRECGGTKGRGVLEVGAGGSRVLPYLGRRFGCRVFGSDFSPRGCRLLQANLALQGVDGAVVCEDLFQSSLAPAKFDLVFSSGLIEHFDDTPGVIRQHLRLVKPGGRLVVIVPNLQGVQGKIVRRLAPPLWAAHRVLGPDELRDILHELGLVQIRSGYLGSFLIRILRDPSWTVARSWPEWGRALVFWSLRLLNGMISLLFRLSPWRPHSRALSHACFAAGIKPLP